MLPFAFGTVARTTTPCARRCWPEADVLEQRLDAVDDLVELRLDLTFDTDASVAAVRDADPDLRGMAERARGPGRGSPSGSRSARRRRCAWPRPGRR